MKKIILLSIAFIFLTIAGDTVHAQVTEKKEEEKKPTTTTVDAWREAVPSSEQPAVITIPVNDVSEISETSRKIEERITDLETKLAESLKTSNSGMLRQLLADDFVPVGRIIADGQTGKNGFIDWVLKNSEHKMFTVEKMSVRVYGTNTAIASVEYKKVSNDGAATGEVFVATDVWIKRANLWQLVSHHITLLPKS